MKGLTPSFLLSTSVLFSVANAVTLDLVGKRKQGSSLFFPRRLKRDAAGVFGNGSVALHNLGDTTYRSNVTLGGKDFEVIIDTGSLDLWVHGDVPGTKDLGIPMNITYADGTVQGNISTAQLQFDGFTIENQAYIRAEFTQDLEDVNGIIGLGPSGGSEVVRLLQSSAGDPPLDRIFQSNPSTPNILTFLLSRNATAETSDTAPLSEQYPAQLTIGTTIPGLETITNAPKLPVLINQSGEDQHWMTLLDVDGIVANGKKISTSTAIRNPTNGTTDQLHVLFDSGFTFPQLPKTAVDAIYGDIPGAEFIKDGAAASPDLAGLENFYKIPCDYEVNVSFFFAGQEFPVSPLDLSFGGPTSTGEDVCISLYQPIDDDIAGNPDFGAFDVILGMGFLRNTYILINFGDFVDGSTSNVADPYIQLLSISDKAKIHQDFVNARLGANGNETETENGNGNALGNGNETGNNEDSKGNGALSFWDSTVSSVSLTVGVTLFSALMVFFSW
ncbi:hypothetical protein D9758_002480 [Tetrapyrgos nigripes]|uniref:Peptidase A1 domain-containing protein n=1 Tax=Tetrapyrgos nigripes TaxID=182062 RepID=A0A8H5GRH0_9AGAR|nr:hypothetical protein D9758_002480 [Tetrapyrgos nigripes]